MTTAIDHELLRAVERGVGTLEEAADVVANLTRMDSSIGRVLEAIESACSAALEARLAGASPAEIRRVYEEHELYPDIRSVVERAPGLIAGAEADGLHEMAALLRRHLDRVANAKAHLDSIIFDRGRP